MNYRKEFIAARELACSACGTLFTCNPAGPCWCAQETVRLPMPAEGAECLCRDCLNKLAATQAARSA